MACFKVHPGISVLLTLSTVFLILLFASFQYFGFAFNSAGIHSHDVKPTVAYSASKWVGIPFGKRDTLQLSHANKSTVEYEDLHHNHTAILDKLRKRESAWDTTVLGGQQMLDLLNSRRVQSQYNHIADLQASGWTVTSRSPDPDRLFSEPGGPNQDLGIDVSYSIEVRVDQNQHFRNCHHPDILLNPIGAYFLNTYNAHSGTIVGSENYGPRYIIKRFGDPNARVPGDVMEKLPDVYKLSDAMWAIWADEARRANVYVDTLKYIFRYNVVTDETETIMQLAYPKDPSSADLEPALQEVEWNIPWPGLTYFEGSEGFRALLGTPHGKSVAYMLAQHPIGLAGKNIKRITMFTTSAGGAEGLYCLLFELSS